MRAILKYTLLPLFLFQACSDEIKEEKFDIDWIYSDEGRMEALVTKRLGSMIIHCI